jgi:hypothetical protein
VSPWIQDGHRPGKDEALDDASVEDLLAGRYQGDAPDLVAVSRSLERVRSLADRPPPPPSAALARILGGSAPARGPSLPTSDRRWARDPAVGPAGRPAERPWAAAAPSRPRVIRVLTVAAPVTAVLIALVLAAGSVRRLPGPTQDVVARIVRTMTPFDFPQQRRSEAVPAKAPRQRAAPPSHPHTSAPGEPTQPDPGEPETTGSQPLGGVGTDTRSQPGGAYRAPPPAVAAPRTNRPPPPRVTGPAPPPPAKAHGFTADLVGAIGAETTGDPDGHGTAVLDVDPGRDELCLTLVVSDLAQVDSAHLHAGSTEVSGPIVAAFVDPAGGTSAACVTVDHQLLTEIESEPESYYVDVHTTEFPDGALRGQLAR